MQSGDFQVRDQMTAPIQLESRQAGVAWYSRVIILGVLFLALSACQESEHAPNLFVGHLTDYSGQTAFVGRHYGPGVADALRYINKHGGINGSSIVFQTVDYAYDADAAISIYRRWADRNKMVGLQGWGTQDTEALRNLATADRLPIWSASYSGHLTDPTGRNPATDTAAPYNFFYGPSYSDACRALLVWASEDAETRSIERPGFIHVGADLPYPNAPKAACAEYGLELGFAILPAIIAPLEAGDYQEQCRQITASGANYVYLANLGDAVISLLKSCRAEQVQAVFMTNIWGGDRQTIEAAQAANLVFPSATPFWDSQSVSGMTLVRRIYAGGEQLIPEPTHHYIRGVCSVFYMKEAMEWAAIHGGLSGDNIRQGMYARRNWVPLGLEGVCAPSTWTPDDHRGTTSVTINRGQWVESEVQISQLRTVDLPRREEWIGY